jgi:hypothetical protein
MSDIGLNTKEVIEKHYPEFPETILLAELCRACARVDGRSIKQSLKAFALARIVCQSCGGEGCEDCNDEGGWDGEIPIGWDTIKLIHQAAVEACALPAVPQEQDAMTNQSKRVLDMVNSPATPDGWIPVSERLPDDTVDADGGATCYLVLYAEGRQPNGGSNVQVSNVTYLRRWHEGMITHWMPLPEPPMK